jgi:hypothetical protein
MKFNLWPVTSLSDRIRLLPLLLGEKGLVMKALQYTGEFKENYLSQDQIVPDYTVFKMYLDNHLKTNRT